MYIQKITQDINRVFIIADTHFGLRNNSIEWLQIQQNYFDNFFIPLLKKHYKPGDILIHLGDVFDSRQSINLRVLDSAMKTFEKISNILPVYMICGNHDIYQQKSNEINSLKVFKWLKNVNTFTKPAILKSSANNKELLLMPWQNLREQEKNIITTNKTDFLFCHTDIQNLKFNRKVNINEGNKTELFNDFTGVYTGHIHYSQHYANIRAVGSPYQITRSDIGNPKGIWLLDLKSDTEEFFENNISPKFLKIKLTDVLNYNLEEIDKIFTNNFIDILISTNDVVTFPFTKFLNLIHNVKYRNINPVVIDNEYQSQEGENKSEIEELDLLELSKNYIDNLQYKKEIKNKMKNYIDVLYNKFLKYDNE